MKHNYKYIMILFSFDSPIVSYIHIDVVNKRRKAWI